MKPWTLVALLFALWYGAEALMQATDRWLSPEPAATCAGRQPFTGLRAQCTRMVSR